MIAYGTISRGQKVTIIKGAGFSFTLYERAGAIKTPQASGAENRTALNCYNTHNTPLSDVNKKIDFRA